jgi:hypothetical protein
LTYLGSWIDGGVIERCKDQNYKVSTGDATVA